MGECLNFISGRYLILLFSSLTHVAVDQLPLLRLLSMVLFFVHDYTDAASLVVPRTFMGPAILATLCHILRWTILLPLRIDILDYPMIMQFIARGFLLLINAHGWIRLASTFEQKSKLQYSGTWFLLITASQFHMSFYARYV